MCLPALEVHDDALSSACTLPHPRSCFNALVCCLHAAEVHNSRNGAFGHSSWHQQWELGTMEELQGEKGGKKTKKKTFSVLRVHNVWHLKTDLSEVRQLSLGILH